MLADMAQAYREVSEIFEKASHIFGEDLWEVAQVGPQEKLNTSRYTQPILMASSFALWRIWEKLGGKPPSDVAGHSFGELSALVCAGVCSFEVGIRIAIRRSQLMEKLTEKEKTGMVAILGLKAHVIQDICEEISTPGALAAIANFNTPLQSVVSGHTLVLKRLSDKALASGAKKCMPLAVSVPSHCKLMEGAARDFSRFLKKLTFMSAKVQIWQNVDASPHTDAREILPNIADQLYCPVLWVDTLFGMVGQGIETFIECGFGKILSGLHKGTSHADISKCMGIGSPEALEKALVGMQS